MQKCNTLLPRIMLVAVLGTAGCTSSTTTTPNGDTSSVNGLIAMGNSVNAVQMRQAQVKKIRYMAIEETALSTGAQAGLASRASYIDGQLTAQAPLLDKVYDFNSLLLEHNVIPPVLLEGRNVLHLADPDTIRLYDRTYKIAKQAHFVTTAPNWRQYLWLDYKVPERPSDTLLPQDATERALWNKNIIIGWNNGVEQANNIFADNVARLKEDLNGMILYRKLLAMNMVSPPFVAETELGVTGDATEMNINDKVLRIAALPGLNTDSKHWQAVVQIDEPALAKFRNMEKLVNTTTIQISDKAWQPVIPNTH